MQVVTIVNVPFSAVKLYYESCTASVGDYTCKKKGTWSENDAIWTCGKGHQCSTCDFAYRFNVTVASEEEIKTIFFLGDMGEELLGVQ